MVDAHPSPELVPGPEDLDEAVRRLEILAEAAASFAHDLKNPLSAILLGVQRLARLSEPVRQPQVRELASRLERSVQAMTRLVDGHADLARLQAGRLSLERTPERCADLLTGVLEPLRAAAAERKQELRVELQADLPEVLWDAYRIGQAIDHLVGTALRLAPEGTVVSFSAEAIDAEIALTVVIETPAGSPLTLPEAAPPRRIRGSGLIVARCLVEAHGGTLALEDTTDRTRLRVSLPSRPTTGAAPATH